MKYRTSQIGKFIISVVTHRKNGGNKCFYQNKQEIKRGSTLAKDIQMTPD
jgi:hypothetical protein